MEYNNNKPPKDFFIKIEMPPAKTDAYIYITPPENGGKHFTKDDVYAAIKRFNIKFGLNEEVVNSIVSDMKYSQRIHIATAQMPVNGENGTITYNYSQKVEAAPKEDDFGFVDYKDLGLIRTVYQGDVIAEITPPTEGVPGVDVTGGVMRQIPGKKASYTVGKNTRLTEDGLQIVADIDGHLVCRGGIFSVENIVTISGDVDVAVGNIDFVGDVIIKGSVLEGFKVSSKSNIMVSGAVLEAGGNVVIKNGCINSNITAHGTFSALFCEHSKIKCDGDVSAQNYVICDVYCGGTLITKGMNGGIIGGRYVVLNTITVSNIGSRNYIPTEITLGDNAILAEEKNQLNIKIAKLQKSIDELTLIVNFLNEKKKELHHLPDDKEFILGNAARQKIVNNVEISNANKRIREIDVALATKQNLYAVCKGHIFPGVKITINDITFLAQNEYVNSRVFINSSGEITVSIA